MELRIPVNGGVDMQGRVAACVRLMPNRDTEVFRGVVAQSNLAVTDGTHVTCRVTRLGRYVVRFTGESVKARCRGACTLMGMDSLRLVLVGPATPDCHVKIILPSTCEPL